MPTERVQRQIDRLLDEADEASVRQDWQMVKDRANAALAFDPENSDALSYLAAADRGSPTATATSATAAPQTPGDSPGPTSFANGRYTVKRFLGEGGKKRVYLAHDSLLDRDVAFALIKTEGLDDAGRVRIQREAQAMGRLGNHPNIVTVYDIGDENGQPYLVLPILSGGDVEGVIEKAPEHKLPLEQAIRIAIETCQGMELAHSRGIVHRDLKPGNVWLTEDGRAMIGDFGLAVAADRSRLTQAGMMVGTVSYMPPEQAMGGEIGPRSDLYSLGAMLYEMVCGRPPFVGDESVAIIGQHLNTPPVAPSWHRPDCPPALEALILRLLEKDPSKRPTSATEVREALGNVTPSRATTSRDPSIATATPPSGGGDPLYRRTFVGRENEVRQLQAAFDGALSGSGGLVMVVGEPGIGKTAICEQLATYVSLRGGKTLVGHCYEEGSLSLPYLAFVESMRSYVLARDPDGLRTDLGTGAADVARIVSEVRDRVQGVELRPTGDPEDDRWRLLQSVTSFLKNASTVQPLVVVLEDLHWADRGTLDLLLHVSRNLKGARLLIIGTYRDVEVDRSHPLSGVLADLRRAANFSRVPLRGLTIDEVHRMYQALRGNDVPWAQAEAVHRQTEGNPLFVQEVLRYLVEEGLVVREGGRYVPQVDPGVGIPEGLRDVVGKRLSHLSEGCNRLLSVAAVIGRDFDLQTLRGVSNLSEDELYAAIEEAVKVGVLEERSMPGAVRYRFAHAFFRQSLYEEMIAPRRLRLHQEVARALESQYAARREEHAAELAEHYGQSTDRSDLAKAVEYSEMAANRAMSVFAYAEAEQHYKRCLEVQEVLDPDDKRRRWDLLFALGEAIVPQENPARLAEALAPEALNLAEELADSNRAARTALQTLGAIRRTLSNARQDRREWVDIADRNTQNGTVERILVDTYQGMALLGEGKPREAHVYLRRSLEAASKSRDNGAYFIAARYALSSLYALRDYERLKELTLEVLERPRENARIIDIADVLFLAGGRLLVTGNRERAEELWKEYDQLASRSQDVTLAARSWAIPAILTFLDGNLSEALLAYDQAVSRASEWGVGPNVVPPPLHLAAHLGLIATRLGSFPFVGRGGISTRALCMSILGQHEEAQILRDQIPGVGSEEDETGLTILIWLFESAIISRDQKVLAGLRSRLLPLESDFFLEIAPLSIGRLLGEAAAVLGETQDARHSLLAGLDASVRIRHRPEIALIRLDLAELLLDHYPDERDAAIEHLDFAIAEFQAMKMQPALERALGHRGLLKA